MADLHRKASGKHPHEDQNFKILCNFFVWIVAPAGDPGSIHGKKYEYNNK